MRFTPFGLAIALLAGVAAAAPPVPPSAQGAGVTNGDHVLVEGRLYVENETVRAGEPVRVGVYFELEPGWHVYWRNSGQSGLPTKLDWKIAGATVGPISWPFPEVFREADGFITTYGYADEVLLISEAVFAPGAGGAVEARVDADFLVCEVQCIPGELHLSRTIHVSDAASLPDPETHAFFEEWSARVPRDAAALGIELEAVYSLSAIRPGDAFRGALAARGCGKTGSDSETCAELMPGARDAQSSFIPDQIAGIEVVATGGRKPEFLAGGVLLTLSGRASADPPKPGSERLRGVLALLRDDQPAYVEVDLPLPRAAAGTPVAAIESPWLEPAELANPALAIPLWRALLLALAGGLILNLMPCVLPVLAIKVFGIAELAHRHRGEVIRHGVAYLAGVLLTMLALAAIVIALRAAGTSVGWGFQFQEPIFVAAVAAVLVVFALNLFGVFEIGFDATRIASTGAGAVGARRSFFEGLLAVVVATPCSAPFLGTAVGFAFASEWPLIVAIFLAIGVGLALPFVLIALVPAWARFIPRSGAWMLQLRAVLGFALLATVVWLLWIMGRSAGAGAQTALLAYLLVVAAGVWGFGVLQRADRPVVTRVVSIALALLALFGLSALPVAEARPVRGPVSAASDTLGRAFAPVDVQAALARGAPVFVYFTADWCLTCKVNEHVIFADARVRDALAQRGVETFVGDWTRRDETIRSELARYGKAGVPLYLVYSPDAPDAPRVLPEILTIDLFLDALEQATPAAKEKS
jgi:thiol:disulfide interchange protein/DsbC/DsbD-like thiol-disulfide interchange protein